MVSYIIKILCTWCKYTLARHVAHPSYLIELIYILTYQFIFTLTLLINWLVRHNTSGVNVLYCCNKHVDLQCWFTVKHVKKNIKRITIYKNHASFLYSPLYHLFTLSLNKHTIPLEWCTHTIIPVFKSGDRVSVTNYSPILLMCNTSKVIEKLSYMIK